MKKKCTFSFLLCLTFLITLGQNDNFAFNPDTPARKFKGSVSSWQTHIIADDDSARALISFADRDNVYYYLVDTAFRTLGKYVEIQDSLPLNYYTDKYQVILQSSRGHSFTTYFLQKGSNELYTETSDFTRGVSVFNQAGEFGPKETFLAAWEDKGHVYFLTHPGKSRILRFYIDEGTVPKDVVLNLHDDLTDIDLERDLKDIQVIRESREPNLLAAQGKTKLYVRPGRSLVLTLDQSSRYTALWKFDLNDAASDARILHKDHAYCNSVSNPNLLETNSYVYQDRILQAVFWRKDLLMQYKEIATDSVIREFHVSRDSVIRFASSGLITKGNPRPENATIYFGKEYDDTRTFNEYDLNTKDLFRAINRSSLGFVIVPQDGYLIIKTGEANVVKTVIFDFDIPVVGGVTHFAGVAVHWTLSIDVYASRINLSETYIMTVLQQDNLDLVRGIHIQTKYDKIADLEHLMKDRLAAETNFEFNGKTYFFYWEKDIKKMVIGPVL